MNPYPDISVVLLTIVSATVVCVSMVLASCFKDWLVSAATLLVVGASLTFGFQLGANWQRINTLQNYTITPKP